MNWVTGNLSHLRRKTMNSFRRKAFGMFALLALACVIPHLVAAQKDTTVLSGAELTRVVPAGFYFQGRTGTTQMRNAAAARFGSSRHVIAGLVDTSGYGMDVREKYQGFFITDSPVVINGSDLGIGAYGFGFTSDGKFNILDLAGNQILTVSSANDKGLKRPRPLMMSNGSDGLRLYGGKDYVVVATK
jgi:hypothetical protein